MRDSVISPFPEPMDTQYLKDLIEPDDNYGASVMLERYHPKAEKQFKKLTKNLEKLLKEVQETFPDANYYTAGGGLCLMIGAPHGDGKAESDKPNKQLIAVDAFSLSIGDGDF